MFQVRCIPPCFLLACASRGPLPPPTAPVTVDFSALYGGQSSASVYDPRQVSPDLLARVLVEPTTLAAGTVSSSGRLETWTRQLLLGHLGGLGAVVVGPPDAHVDPALTCPPGGCEGPAPTAWLRDLHFRSDTDMVPIVVTPGQDGVLAVSVRLSADENSICPPDSSLELPYVQLSLTVQRWADHAVVAVLHEVAIVPADDITRVTLDSTEAQRCAAITQAWAQTPALRPGAAAHEQAARTLLSQAFGPLGRAPAATEAGLPAQ